MKEGEKRRTKIETREGSKKGKGNQRKEFIKPYIELYKRKQKRILLILNFQSIKES